MGSSLSKSTRTLPKRPTWAGARTELPSEFQNSPHRPSNPLASETKSETIEADSRDPQFLSNLSKMGQVRVPHTSTVVRPSDGVQRSLRMRLQSEHQALSGVPVHNRLLASTLTDLLDERKDMTTGGKTTGGLSKKYGIDEDLLKRLASHVNSPSIGDTVVSRHVTADGEQLMLMKAAWVEPSAKDASS